MVTEPKTPTLGSIWVIHPGAPDGTMPEFFATGPVAPEAIHFPTANACTVSINGVDIEYLASGYTIPPGNVSPELFSLPPFGAILGWTAAQMTPFIGKAIVPDESTGQIFAYNGPDLIPNTPDATSFSMTGYQLEGNTLVVCPPPPPPLDDRRMTGGGSVFERDGTRVTHGFELHCDINSLPNRLEVNWPGDGKGKKAENNFHLEFLTAAVCTNNPLLHAEQPNNTWNTYTGSGTGKLNGENGATATWVLTDDGEPGKRDTMTITIKDPQGNIVLVVTGNLQNGNQQAH